jgi:hypothetical protein
MAVVETLDTEKAQDFLGEIRRSHPRWAKPTAPTETLWFFRGQHDASLPLLPRAFRNKPSRVLDPLREDIAKLYAKRNFRRQLGATASLITCNDDQLAEAALDALTHAGAVRMFMTLADEVRRPIVHSELLWHVFNEERDEFRQYFAGETNGKPEEIFAIAQHHGLPTQFLDWTLDPLIAAYFAAERADPACADRLAVWAIQRDLFNHQWGLSRFTVRAGVTPFLDAQAGLFTWSRRAYIDRANHGRYLEFDELIRQWSKHPPIAALGEPLLYKVTLPSAHADELLRLLWRERVTPAHLMPTFDHVTMALEQQLRWFGVS